MAILKSQPHIEVRVVIEGRPATEYENNDSEHTPPPAASNNQQITPYTTVVKYIESISDATFEVHFNVYHGYQWTRPCPAFLVEVDENFVSGMTFKNLGPASGSIKGWRKISPTGGWTLLGFKFAGITAFEATEAEQIKIDKEQSVELGTSEVQLHRGICHGVRPPVNEVSTSPITTPFPEKALKGRALSHSTSCSNPVRCEPQLANRFLYYDDLQHPVATYIFRYRSREALHHLSIIPGPDYPEENHVSRPRCCSLNLEAEQEINARYLDQNGAIDLTANEYEDHLVVKPEAQQERHTQELHQTIGADLTKTNTPTSRR